MNFSEEDTARIGLHPVPLQSTQRCLRNCLGSINLSILNEFSNFGKSVSCWEVDHVLKNIKFAFMKSIDELESVSFRFHCNPASVVLLPMQFMVIECYFFLKKLFKIDQFVNFEWIYRF